MILDIFPTHIFQKDDVLSRESLEDIYNFVIMNKGGVIVTPSELSALSELKTLIEIHAKELSAMYNFESVEVSNRFSTHFFPAGENGDMETHSDDLGDFGRKLIAFLYLEADEEGGGELEMFDPRWMNAPWVSISKGYKIKPKTNRLVIFPTFMWHKVNSYFSTTCPRIAIDVVIRIK